MGTQIEEKKYLYWYRIFPQHCCWTVHSRVSWMASGTIVCKVQIDFFRLTWLPVFCRHLSPLDHGKPTWQLWNEKKIGKRKKKTAWVGVTRVKICSEELAAKTCSSWSKDRGKFETWSKDGNKKQIKLLQIFEKNSYSNLFRVFYLCLEMSSPQKITSDLSLTKFLSFSML